MRICLKLCHLDFFCESSFHNERGIETWAYAKSCCSIDQYSFTLLHMIGRSKGNERSADLHVTLYEVLLDVCGSPISNSSKSKCPTNIFTVVYPSIHDIPIFPFHRCFKYISSCQIYALFSDFLVHIFYLIVF